MFILFCIIAYLIIGFVVVVSVAVFDEYKGINNSGYGAFFGLFCWPVVIIFISTKSFDNFIQIIAKKIISIWRKNNGS